MSTADSIVERLKRAIEAQVGVGYTPATFDPDPFFNLFQEAYEGGHFEGTGVITPDELRTRDMWDENTDQVAVKIFESVMDLWDQWRYAWDRYTSRGAP